MLQRSHWRSKLRVGRAVCRVGREWSHNAVHERVHANVDVDVVVHMVGCYDCSRIRVSTRRRCGTVEFAVPEFLGELSCIGRGLNYPVALPDTALAASS
jgi:hypothetical protein